MPRDVVHPPATITVDDRVYVDITDLTQLLYVEANQCRQRGEDLHLAVAIGYETLAERLVGVRKNNA